MPGSCPSCRGEWWTSAATCPDCGVALVDGPLPDLEPRPEPATPKRNWADGPPVHESTRLDLSSLDESSRWRLTIELEASGIPHLRTADGLTVPADAVAIAQEVVDALVLDADAGAASGRPPAEPPPEAAIARREPGARRIVAWVIDAVVSFAVATAVSTSLASVTMSRPARYAAFVVFFAVPVTVGTAVWGRSLGKAMLGLVVEQADGRPLRVRAALVRSVVAFSPLWIAMLPWPSAWDVATRWSFYAALAAIALSTLVDPDHRGLHDKIAGTAVRSAV